LEDEAGFLTRNTQTSTFARVFCNSISRASLQKIKLSNQTILFGEHDVIQQVIIFYEFWTKVLELIEIDLLGRLSRIYL